MASHEDMVSRLALSLISKVWPTARTSVASSHTSQTKGYNEKACASNSESLFLR
jgi:hypothetical protein